MITLMFRILYSVEMLGNMQKGEECGDNMFIYGKGHLYFYLAFVAGMPSGPESIGNMY